MKLSLSILALLCTSFVSADLSFFGSQKILDDKVPVEGDNPLVYCQASHDNDILILESVDLFPNPPVPYVLSPPSPSTFRYRVFVCLCDNH